MVREVLRVMTFGMYLGGPRPRSVTKAARYRVVNDWQMEDAR
jgi:hypothetical protein